MLMLNWALKSVLAGSAPLQQVLHALPEPVCPVGARSKCTSPSRCSCKMLAPNAGRRRHGRHALVLSCQEVGACQ